MQTTNELFYPSLHFNVLTLLRDARHLILIPPVIPGLHLRLKAEAIFVVGLGACIRWLVAMCDAPATATGASQAARKPCAITSDVGKWEKERRTCDETIRQA